MANEIPSVRPIRDGERSSPVPDPQAEVAELREETLRLRDLLITRDAELGREKGRVAELEQQARYLRGAMLRLQHHLVRLLRVAGKLRRRLRGG
jgi:hypothetical protein